ncbi:hypothetical protein HUT16_03480 [Kitasatospora sp. NA04385]|uniref:hypothetical protein n=1 Tax=Kitasatospora sp. NA04385 TaxID=2742135 RepID=UPI00159082F0|nr:hypothetical protein [Kitasatospora sp. NA04385]QKW18251.1 hypothetical protein HUT16_03480 [Kitasatospora sp. NA04385]
MITRVEEGEAVAQGDEVVRALLAAMATLEDLVTGGHDSHVALSTLEEMAYELGRMDAGEHQRFIEGLERVAAEEPSRAAWIRGIPDALGLDH